MGLLKKINAGTYSVPAKITKKDDITLDKNVDNTSVFLSDFLILNKISIFAEFTLQDNHFFVTNSFGYDAASIICSYSTKDFWNGLIKEQNKLYQFDLKSNSIIPLLQFFSNEQRDFITNILIYKLNYNKIILLASNIPFINKSIILQQINKINSSNLDFQINKANNQSGNNFYFSIDTKYYIESIVENNIQNNFYLKPQFIQSLQNELFNRLVLHFNDKKTKIFKSSENDFIFKISTQNEIQDYKLLIKHINYNLENLCKNNTQKLALKIETNYNSEKDFFGWK